MADLVPMRELVRNETARGHSDNIDAAIAQGGFDILFESAIVRASLPKSPLDIALCCSVMGGKDDTSALKTSHRPFALYPFVHEPGQ